MHPAPAWRMKNMVDKPLISGDECGYAATLKSSLHYFAINSRQTGRTSRLIERVKDGDQIVAPSAEVARYIERRLREYGKNNIKVFSVSPSEMPLNFVGTAHHGRTFFEHSWVERFFINAIDQAEKQLESYSIAMSKTWPEAPKPQFLPDQPWRGSNPLDRKGGEKS
jgi:hypothetical protein